GRVAGAPGQRRLLPEPLFVEPQPAHAGADVRVGKPAADPGRGRALLDERPAVAPVARPHPRRRALTVPLAVSRKKASCATCSCSWSPPRCSAALVAACSRAPPTPRNVTSWCRT